MYRNLTLALVLLTCAAWLQAQAGYPQSQKSQTPGATDQASVEGCLQGSSGKYTLSADSGSIYQLTGDTSNLSEHVGHEVRITGTTSSASSPSSSPNAVTPGTSPQATLDVKSMKHISKTCKATAK